MDFLKRFLSFSLVLVLSISLFASCNNSGEQPNSSEPEPDPIVYNPNPLTGLEKASDYPNGERPIAFAVNNIGYADPQNGLSKADITYEIVAEGGITRFLAVYADYRRINTIGSLRSARDQHLQCMFPLNAIYMHIGASTTANNMLEKYKYGDKEIDGNYQSVRDIAFYFDNNAPGRPNGSEHGWFTTAELIEEAIDKLDIDTAGEPDPIFNFVPYYEEDRQLTGGTADSFTFRFSDYRYDPHPVFTYDTATGTYLREQFGAPHIDRDNGEQLAYKNVIVLFAEIEPYSPGDILMNVNFQHGGYGYYFCNGQYERVRWVKGNPEQPLRIVDLDGNEIDVQINAGNTYVAIVDLDEYDYLQITGAPIEEPAESETEPA